jgi:ectoine hydroxylase-related dioxygenase (phytanoyl-CoA dioxygenase family)
MGTVSDRLPAEQFEGEGFLSPVAVLTADEVAAFRSALDGLEAQNVGPLKRLDNAHLFFPWAYRLATHVRVADAVAQILGGDVLIDGSLMLCKYPHDRSYVSWHQDSVYSHWHLSPSVSAWIALSSSTPTNGCMRVIPRSHTRGLLDHAEVADRDNMLRRGERIGAGFDEGEAVDLVLRPGEMSLHHSRVIHGSNPNRTDEKRIGFIVRFATSRIKPQDRPMVRVRGGGDDRHLQFVGAPAETDTAHALAAWREFNQRRQATSRDPVGSGPLAILSPS